jgi:hypothetical protein
MGIKFNDLYVKTIASGLLESDERLLARSVGEHQPWWSMRMPIFRHTYLMLATDQRLRVIDHRRGLIHERMDTVTSVPWSALDNVKVSGFLFMRKVKMSAPSQGLSIKCKVSGGLLPPVKDNIGGIKAVHATWQTARALPAGSARPALPMAAAA